MRKYMSIFRIRFISGLQYRAAAYAGMATQFVWGFMTILMFWSFYQADAKAFPMEFSQLSTYIWLQQAFLALFMAWFFENEIFESITNGNVSYELCRPIDIYNMWFARNMASRLSKAVLRCLPILVVCVFLPHPYGISQPANITSAILFSISITLGFIVLVAFNMLIYISAFYTISSMGIRILSVSLVEFLSGAVIPLPFLPGGIRKTFELLPFASMQNTPFLIYTGNMGGEEAIVGVILQVFWLVVLFLTGKLLMKKALKKIVIQGG